MIRYACPHCRTVQESPDSEGGAAVPCPRCGQLLRVPPPVVLAAEETDLARAVQPPPDLDPLFPPAPRRPSRPQPIADVLPAEPDRRGAVRPTRRTGPPPWVQVVAAVALVGGGCLVLGGCGVIVAALVRSSEAFSAQAEPDEVQLTDLLARWPRGNHHVVLTHFVCGSPIYVGGTERTPSGIWIPVYTPEDVGQAGGGVPRKIRALVYCAGEEKEDEVLQECRRGRVQGLATRGIGLDYTGQKLLRKHSPDTDFFACLEIEVGRRPVSPTVIYGLAGGGAVAVLLGAVIGLISFCTLLPGVVRAGLAAVLSPFRRNGRPPAERSQA